MKIINNNWQRQIVLEDNLIHTIVFENKKYYRESILELIRQHKGYEGNFILSNNNKEVSFDKNSYFISDLFNIDENLPTLISSSPHNFIPDILLIISSENCIHESMISILCFLFFFILL